MGKRIIRIILSLIICFAILPIRNIEAKEAFDIEEHNIIMKVQEDGTIKIEEEMKVHFNEQRHGIYVNIPKMYRLKWQLEDGKQVYKEYTFPITHVSVVSDHNYMVDESMNEITIQIGSGDYFAKEYETYIWSYDIHTKDLDLNGQQMILMNVITDGWNTTTDFCRFEIEFPKEIEINNVYTTTLNDEVINGNGQAGDVVINVSNNKISGYTTRRVESYEKIVIQVLLEDNYFTLPEIDKGFYNIIYVVVGFAVLVAILFLIFGKDDDLIITSDFVIPDDITPAEASMIINQDIDDRAIASTFLDWGRKGFITIKEEKGTLLFTKVCDLTDDAKSYEKILFNGLFLKRTEVTSDSLINSFYTTFESAKNNLNINYDIIKSLMEQTSSKVIKIILCILVPAIITIVNLVAYRTYAEYMYVISWIADFWTVTVAFQSLVFSIVGLVLLVKAINGIYKYKNKKTIIMVVIGSILIMLPIINMAMKLYSISVEIYYIALIFGALIGLIICTIFMSKRSSYGNIKLGKALSIKNMLLDIDEDRLKVLTEENPMFFYDILPYAYALALTDVWQQHFKDLSLKKADWYKVKEKSHSFNSAQFEYNMARATKHFTERPREHYSYSSSTYSSSGNRSYSSSSWSSSSHSSRSWSRSSSSSHSSGGHSSGGFGGSRGGSW